MMLLGWALIQSDWCLYKKKSLRQIERHQECTCTEVLPCEEAGGWSYTSKGERPQSKPAMLASWFLISSIQNCEKIHFYFLSHPVYTVCHGSPSNTEDKGTHSFCLWSSLYTLVNSFLFKLTKIKVTKIKHKMKLNRKLLVTVTKQLVPLRETANWLSTCHK